MDQPGPRPGGEGPAHPLSAADYMPAGRLRELQLRRLRETVAHAYARTGTPEGAAPGGPGHTPGFYRRKMDEAGVKPEDIQTLDDIRRLPFTDKDDLRDTYPDGLFAEPPGRLARVHASSGTTGKPIVAAYTARDLEVWSEAVARSLLACGLGPGDILHVAYGYGLFTGALGLHYGAERLGLMVIPAGTGATERQITLLRDLRPTAICCTPSYFLHLAERAAASGLDLRGPDCALRTGVFGAEPWSEGMRGRIQEASRLRAFDIYGLTEITGPGVAAECRRQDGLHLWEDHFYPEILDPDTGEPVPGGEEGELAITTLSKRAMPLLRYRTRDLTRLLPGPCACGRTVRRMARVGRRSDDMLIVRGVNVFPSQVEGALLSVAGVAPHYLIALDRLRGLDRMEVRVEYGPERFGQGEGDGLAEVERFRQRVARAVADATGVHADIRLVEPGSLPRAAEGKARRVLDERKA